MVNEGRGRAGARRGNQTRTSHITYEMTLTLTHIPSAAE